MDFSLFGCKAKKENMVGEALPVFEGQTDGLLTEVSAHQSGTGYFRPAERLTEGRYTLEIGELGCEFVIALPGEA